METVSGHCRPSPPLGKLLAISNQVSLLFQLHDYHPMRQYNETIILILVTKELFNNLMENCCCCYCHYYHFWPIFLQITPRCVKSIKEEPFRIVGHVYPSLLSILQLK